MPFEETNEKARAYDNWKKVIIIIGSILIPALAGFFWIVVNGTRFVDLVTTIRTEQVKQTKILKSHSHKIDSADRKIDSINIRVVRIEKKQKNQTTKRR